jgi:hypothetical protein
MESVPTALRLVAVVALVAANGIFPAAEFAIVAVRRTRLIPLAEGGSKTARFVHAPPKIPTHISPPHNWGSQWPASAWAGSGACGRRPSRAIPARVACARRVGMPTP